MSLFASTTGATEAAIDPWYAAQTSALAGPVPEGGCIPIHSSLVWKSNVTEPITMSVDPIRDINMAMSYVAERIRALEIEMTVKNNTYQRPMMVSVGVQTNINEIVHGECVFGLDATLDYARELATTAWPTLNEAFPGLMPDQPNTNETAHTGCVLELDMIIDYAQELATTAWPPLHEAFPGLMPSADGI